MEENNNSEKFISVEDLKKDMDAYVEECKSRSPFGLKAPSDTPFLDLMEKSGNRNIKAKIGFTREKDEDIIFNIEDYIAFINMKKAGDAICQ